MINLYVGHQEHFSRKLGALRVQNNRKRHDKLSASVEFVMIVCSSSSATWRTKGKANMNSQQFQKRSPRSPNTNGCVRGACNCTGNRIYSHRNVVHRREKFSNWTILTDLEMHMQLCHQRNTCLIAYLITSQSITLLTCVMLRLPSAIKGIS